MRNAKIIVLGDMSVGKTALIHRLVYNTFKRDFKSTLGVDIFKKTFDDLDIELRLWDFSGQKIFESLRQAFYLEAEGALIVFDITRKETFDSVINWWEEAKRGTSKEDLPVIVLANKSDLESSQELSETVLKELLDRIQVKNIQTSAKTGEHVEEAFRDISKAVLEN